jgi:hypothetical protein
MKDVEWRFQIEGQSILACGKTLQWNSYAVGMFSRRYVQALSRDESSDGRHCNRHPLSVFDSDVDYYFVYRFGQYAREKPYRCIRDLRTRQSHFEEAMLACHIF